MIIEINNIPCIILEEIDQCRINPLVVYKILYKEKTKYILVDLKINKIITRTIWEDLDPKSREFKNYPDALLSSRIKFYKYINVDENEKEYFLDPLYLEYNRRKHIGS